MSKDTDKSLFIVSSIPRFYQQLLAGIEDYRALGNRIIKRIELAHAFRQVEQVRELSRILINIPIKEHQLIAQYYLIWCKCRDYQYPATVLENIIEQTRTYKTKAIFSRAAIEIYQGNLEHAFYFYTEAFKTSPTISEYIDLARSIAGLKSLEGSHDSALGDLEKLVPLIKHAEPRLYYDFLNSYSVELGEVGRKQEARNISRLVLASPFAYAYPEWQDTANDLRGYSRSFVAIGPSRFKPRNVVTMPPVEHGKVAVSLGEPARILDLGTWKAKMAKGRKKNGDKKKPIEEMDEKDMFLEIMKVYTSDSTTDEQRRKIFHSVIKITSEPSTPTPDDSDGA